jgi:hypothetical protein
VHRTWCDVHLAGRTRVGLHGEGLLRDRAQTLEHPEHDLGPDGAVHADHVGAPRVEAYAEVLGAGAVQADALAVDGHLRHHRQVRRFGLARREGRVDLGQVAERLRMDAVHVAGEQRPTWRR